MGNRFTPYLGDLMVGDKVWFFYTHAHTRLEKAEGIFEGRIVSFQGLSLNIAKVYNRALGTYININIRQLNKI